MAVSSEIPSRTFFRALLPTYQPPQRSNHIRGARSLSDYSRIQDSAVKFRFFAQEDSTVIVKTKWFSGIPDFYLRNSGVLLTHPWTAELPIDIDTTVVLITCS